MAATPKVTCTYMYVDSRTTHTPGIRLDSISDPDAEANAVSVYRQIGHVRSKTARRTTTARAAALASGAVRLPERNDPSPMFFPGPLCSVELEYRASSLL